MAIWRPITAEDGFRLTELISACRKADGDDPISQLVADALKATLVDTKNTLGAVAADGSLMAAGWITALEELRVAIGGKVHPDFRQRGLGNCLMKWAINRADELLQTENSIQLVITNESLNEDAHRFYQSWGFELEMAEQMRVFDLDQPIPTINFPEGIAIISWSSNTSDLFFRAYQDSFRERPGFPGFSAENWINGNLEFRGFRPDLSLLARFENEPVGFLTVDVFSGLGWISQVGVVPAWRGKGLATALIVEVLHRFDNEGYKQAALHVNINNPSAIDLFSHLGFAYRLERARYVKEIKSPSNRGLERKKIRG